MKVNFKFWFKLSLAIACGIIMSKIIAIIFSYVGFVVLYFMTILFSGAGSGAASLFM